MEKEPRFRILNKTSKTVTVKLMGKPMTFSWVEFNKKLIVVDKFWAILNETEKKKQDEAEDLINNAIICVMLQRGNADTIKKLSALAKLADIVDKLQEILECSNAEVLQLIRKRLMLLNPFMTNPMFDTHKNNSFIRKYEEESKKKYKEECDKYESGKTTFGDAFYCLSELIDKLSK